MLSAELSPEDRHLIEIANTFLDERDAATRRRRDSLKEFAKSLQRATEGRRNTWGARLLAASEGDTGRLEENRVESQKQIRVFLEAQRRDATQRVPDVNQRHKASLDRLRERSKILANRVKSGPVAPLFAAGELTTASTIGAGPNYGVPPSPIPHDPIAPFTNVVHPSLYLNADGGPFSVDSRDAGISVVWVFFWDVPQAGFLNVQAHIQYNGCWSIQTSGGIYFCQASVYTIPTLVLAQDSQYAEYPNFGGPVDETVDSGPFDFVGAARFGHLDNADYLVGGGGFIVTPGRLMVQVRIQLDGSATNGIADWSFAAPLFINIPYILLLLYDLPPVL
jgi:hypothetical protein